jgi:hypothetical protein
MKEAASMLTATRCSRSLAVLLATLVNPSFGEEPLSHVQIAKIGKAGTALVESKGRGLAGYGSAFCIHPSGLFITNEHVAQGDLTLIPGSKAEKAYKVKIVRSDKKLDLALLRIDGVKDLPTLSLGSDDKLAELMELVAVGFPFGKLPGSEKGYPSASINVGSVTALRRKDSALHRIQLDAALNPGNSGGPALDKNGKVVGVVVAGIRGSGVNFAIPVSVLARFVARPDIQFDPPQLDPANIHKPVLFEAVVLPVLKPTTPITVELLLKAGKGKERTILLKAAADGKYHARVVPLPPPPGGATVRLLAQFENSLLNATTADRTFKVGGREVKLSEVAKIQFRPAVRVVLHDGKAVEGVVSGLGAVPVRLGEQSVPLNLVKAAAVLFGPAAETDQVDCTLVVRQGETEILRQTERLAVESLLPTPAAQLSEVDGRVGPSRKVFLTTLQEAVYSGEGPLGKGSITGKKGDPLIKVQGERYPNGLGTHPLRFGFASVKYKLNGTWRMFSATAAINDDVRRPRTPLHFKVIGDNRVLWQSKPLGKTAESQKCEVDITGVKTLELRVDCPGPHDHAQAVWLDPYVSTRLERQK